MWSWCTRPLDQSFFFLNSDLTALNSLILINKLNKILYFNKKNSQPKKSSLSRLLRYPKNSCLYTFPRWKCYLMSFHSWKIFRKLKRLSFNQFDYFFGFRSKKDKAGSALKKGILFLIINTSPLLLDPSKEVLA